MKILLFIWAGINTLLASWIAYMLFFNVVVTFFSRAFNVKNLNNAGLFLLFMVTVCHFLMMLLINKYYSQETMVLFTALVSFHWCAIAYFLMQKFSSPAKKSAKLSSSPSYMSKRVLFSLISAATSIVLFFDWQWIFLFILAWIIYGFTCTEIAIRREMKFLKGDRGLAISSLNDYQGRSWSSWHKYPFPNFL